MRRTIGLGTDERPLPDGDTSTYDRFGSRAVRFRTQSSRSRTGQALGRTCVNGGKPGRVRVSGVIPAGHDHFIGGWLDETESRTVGDRGRTPSEQAEQASQTHAVREQRCGRPSPSDLSPGQPGACKPHGGPLGHLDRHGATWGDDPLGSRARNAGAGAGSLDPGFGGRSGGADPRAARRSGRC
jgi:hypothetical protein